MRGRGRRGTVPKDPYPPSLEVPLPVGLREVCAEGALSPVEFPSAVVVPFAGFRVSRVVVVAGRAVVDVRVSRVVVVARRTVEDVVVVTSVAGRVGAGRVGHLAVLVLFIPVFVRRRSGERSGLDGT